MKILIPSTAGFRQSFFRQAQSEYYTSADYEQYSDKYNELTDLYDDNLYSLWSAKLEIYSALFDAQ